MLETVVQAVINGLLIGGIYALVSIGVTLIFGVVKIVNFSQGEFVMIGMYISFYLATQFGIDPILSLFVSMPVLFVIGVLVQHFLIRRVLGPNDMPQIFLTFALSLLLLNLALMLFSANYRTVHTSYSDEAFHIGGLYIPEAKLIAFIVAMILSFALWLFLHTTDLGKAMRAASQNRDVATLMGINSNRVFCVAFGAALALAGAAGSLLMPFYSAYPFVGQVFVLMAFVAVVLGTLGNVIGVLVASLMMGVAESLGIQFVGADSGLIVVFAMLLFTLAFKPNGLGGGECGSGEQMESSVAGCAGDCPLAGAAGRDRRVCARHFHPHPAVLLNRRRLESNGRLWQAAFAWARRLFRAWRIYVHHNAGRFQHLAVDRNDRRRNGRDARQPADRLALLPPARPLFHHRHHRDHASPDADAEGAPKEIVENPDVVRAYLGSYVHPPTLGEA